MATDPNITRIKFLRSKTANAKPLAADIDEGELAFNLTDRTIFSKTGTNVVELGFGKGGTVAGPINQTVGGITSTGTITAPAFSGALSGNATTATRLQTARTISLAGSATGSISFDGTSNQSISVNVNAVNSLATYARSNADSPTKWAQGVQSVFVSSTQGWPMSYGGVITARPHSNGGGTLQILTAYGSDSGVGGGEIKIRTGDYSGTGNDTWTSWKTLVHSENVNDYSPTKTGVGASGTWGIAVTGNAASATQLQTARTIGGVSFNGTTNINLPGVNTTGNQSTTGNAASATKLQTARTIAISGAVTGTATSFDGSTNIAIATTAIDGSKISTGTIPAARIPTLNQSTTGNAASATKLATARTINGVSFNGTANITVADSTKLPLAGGALTGQLTLKAPTVATTVALLANGVTAPLLIPQMSVGTTYGYVPFMHGAVGSSSGYLQHLSVGAYRPTSTWDNSGMYFAMGGADAGPTSAYILKHTGAISHSSGAVSLEGNATTATRLQTARTINGVSFNGSANITVADSTKLPLAGGTVTGALTVNGTLSVSQFNSTGAYSFLNGGSAQNIMTGGLLASNAYADITKVPTNGIYSKGKVQADGGFQGVLTGNATSATVLQTARTIGGVSFNGSANINLPGVNTAGNQNTTGNAASATKLQTARTIGGVSFNGTANINLPGVNTPGNQRTTGSAASLTTARTINGTSFNGTANITTANWGTARTLTIGNTSKSVNGSANVSWTPAEIGIIGYGQAWSNVKASRSSGVNYTNTTGKPIFVVVNIGGGTSYVDNIEMRTKGKDSEGDWSFIVPNGSTYSCTGQILSWVELR